MAENKLLLSRAKSAVLSRDYDFAARLYKQMLGESPEDEALLLELGSVYSKGGKESQALSVYQKIAQINPENIEALMAMSAIYRRTRNYDESVKVLEKARKIDSKNMQIVYNLGFTYKSMGKYDDAIACFEDVIDQNPNDVLAYNHIGSIYAEQGDHETAISSYLRALKVDSNHPVLQLNLAKSYEALGESEKALNAYENSLKAKPGWLEAVGGYSDLLLKLDRVHEAYAVLRNAVAINPKDARTHTQLGHVYSRQSIFEDAKKEYATALECNSKYDPALVGLADAQENLNEHAEASRTIRRAEEIKPDDSAITQKAAHIMLSANEYADAFERISRLREQNPKDVQALSLLGQYYICNGEWDKVDDCYRKIAEYDPTYSDHFRDGAKRFNQRGDSENEELYLRKALERNPNDTSAMMSLGMLLENARRGKEAFAMYQQANATDTFNAASKAAVARLHTAFGSVDISEYVPPEDDDMQVAGESVDSAVEDVSCDGIEIVEAEGEESESLSPADENTAEESELEELEPESAGMPEPDVEEAENAATSLVENAPDEETPSLLELAESDDDELEMADLPDEEALSDEPALPEDDDVPDETPVAEEPLPVEDDFSFDSLLPENDRSAAPASTGSAGQTGKSVFDNLFDLDWVDMPSSVVDDMIVPPANQAPQQPSPVIPAPVAPSPEQLSAFAASIQQANAAARKAEYAAQQAWSAAQAAADSAQAASAAQTMAPLPPEEPVSAVTDEPVLAALDEQEMKIPELPEAVEPMLELFERLRSLCEYLPPAYYEQFMSSRKRLLLDYVIARLSGNPGLLQQAAERRMPDAAELPAEAQEETGIELATHVVDDVLTLIQDVPDTHLRTAMETTTKDLIEKLIQQ